MARFYAPSGVELEDRDAFLSFYREYYFCLIDDFELERQVEGILCGKTVDCDDVDTIMRWKTGSDGHADGGSVLVTRFGARIKLTDMATSVSKASREELERGSWDEAARLMAELVRGNNIGNTYAATMLHFASHGAFPIYDHFAHAGLVAAAEGRAVPGIVHDRELSRAVKTSASVGAFVRGYRYGYAERIKQLFGIHDFKDRDVDRALWSYGHLFSESATNKRRAEGRQTAQAGDC